MCSRRRHNSTQDDDEEVAGPHPTFFGLRLPTLVGSEQPPPSKSSNSSSAMHTGLILVLKCVAECCGKIKLIYFILFIFYCDLKLGGHHIENYIEVKLNDPIFRQSDTKYPIILIYPEYKISL